MADHDYRGDLDDFVADLRRAWRAVGGPSYAQLECLSARVLRQRRPDGVQFVSLAPSTTSEILSGRRKQALKWPWVLTFLTVLQVAAQRGGIDAGVIGTLDEWKRKHEAVLAAAQPPARPARAGLPRQRDAHERIDVTGLTPTSWTARRDAENEADALLGAYLAMVRRVRAPQGQVDCRDLDAEWLELFLNLESGSEAIRTYETEVVPGLLQTEAYAQAILAQRLPGATADELTRLVELRMQSQRLHRWCRLWAVVEEEAFRSQLIDAQTMRGQVEYLIDLAGQPEYRPPGSAREHRGQPHAQRAHDHLPLPRTVPRRRGLHGAAGQRLLPAQAEGHRVLQPGL